MNTTIKKLTALILVLVMCFSVFSISASAKEDSTEAETSVNNGPSDSYAYIEIALTKATGYDTIVFSVEKGIHQPYGDIAVYDLETNTLTLNSLDAYALDINEMGSDFKIVLNGETRLNHMTVWGFGYGGSLFLTGDGSLTLEEGMGLEAEYSNSVFTIDENVTLTAHGLGLYVADSLAKTPIVIKGRERSGATPGYPKSDDVILPMEYNHNYTETVYLYKNTTRPFKDGDDMYKDCELFAVRAMIKKIGVHEGDGTDKFAVEFAIFELVVEDENYYVGSRITTIDVSDEEYLYEYFREDPLDMRLSDVDPNYEPFSIDYSCGALMYMLDRNGHPQGEVSIVPKNSDMMNRPYITTDTLPEASQNKKYSATVKAQPGNTGGKITSYKLSGSAARFLSIDNKGKITGTPDNYGRYTAVITATEEYNGQSETSIETMIPIDVSVPDNVITFASRINDGSSKYITIKNSSGDTVKTINLKNDIIGPFTIIDISDLGEGSYTATIDGTLTGADIMFYNNVENFTVESGKKCKVVFDVDYEYASRENSIILNVDNLNDAKGLKDLTATITMSDNSTITRNIVRRTTVIPDALENLTIKNIKLTAKDYAGQTVDVKSGSGTDLSINTENFRSYTAYSDAYDIKKITASINGFRFTFEPFEDYTFKKINSADELKYVYADMTASQMRNYDMDVTPTFTVSDYSFDLSFERLSRNATVHGCVSDEDDNPVSSAVISYSQTVNGETSSYNTTTDEQGNYSIKNLVQNKDVTILISKDGYNSVNTTLTKIPQDTEKDFTLSGISALTVYTDKDIYNGSITYSGKASGRIHSLNGSKFIIPLSRDVNGSIKVTLKSSNTAKETIGSVKVTNGRGTITLSPTLLGTIDWSGYDENDENAISYASYPIKIEGEENRLIPGNNSGRADVCPGEYKVSVLKPGTNEAYASQNLTVNENETSYVKVQLPKSAKGESVSSGKFTGPKSSHNGSVYKLSGILTSLDDENISNLHFQIGNTLTWDNNIDNVIINGKAAKIANGYVYKTDNKQIDWSLPLVFTVYCTQNATPENMTQTVSAYVSTEKSTSLIGTVATKYVPNLTLKIPCAVPSIKNISDGMTYYSPSAVPVNGKTSPNSEVSIYDNQKLLCVIKADEKGNYSGNITLTDDSRLHNIYAQALVSGSSVKAKKYVTYNEGQAALKSLTMNGMELPINGDSIAYTTTPSGKVKFTASFENYEKLDTLKYPVNGEEVTSKVFFKVKTLSGYTILQGIPQGNGSAYTCNEYAHGEDYPIAVKVIYLSRPVNHSYDVTYKDESGTEQKSKVSQAIERLDNNTEEPVYDYDSWFDDIVSSGNDLNLSGSSDIASTGDGQVTSETLYNTLVSVLNSAPGDGTYSVLDAESASKKTPSTKGEIKSYVDTPKFNVNERDLQLKKTELEKKGYTVSYYKDKDTKHEMYMFKGLFYYGADAKPVPSLEVTNVYNGIPKVEEDKRLFDNGKPLGSTLDVTYICDKNLKKWYRIQSAVISPNAMSPIHTNSNQIPCSTDAPISYSSSNIAPISAQSGIAETKSGAIAETAAPKKIPSGIGFSIDVKKVTTGTYVGYGASLGSYGVAKYMEFKDIGTPLINENIAKELKMVDPATGESIYKVVKFSEFSYESTGAAYVSSELGNYIGTTFPGSVQSEDCFENFQTYLRDNIRYYGNVQAVTEKTNDKNNGGQMGNYQGISVMAKMMKNQSADLANATTKVQAAIENAKTQGVFTDNVTEGFGKVSACVSIIPGWGAGAALGIDTVNFLMKAARDTNDANLMEAVQDFVQECKKFQKLDNECKDAIQHNDEVVERNKDKHPNTKTIKELMEGAQLDPTPPDDGKDEGDNDDNEENNNENLDEDCELTPVHDPSGIVYEAVLSNPVQDATVELQKYENSKNPLSTWDDSDYLNQDNPLVTGEDGYYRWDVPVGEWHVKASKQGYQDGTSQNDVNATVKHGSINYLPVLPPQLNVNIPLVSYDYPTVESVKAKTDGVYITFSKYMNEADLVKSNFILKDANGNPVSYSLVKVDSEKAPDNIKYSGSIPSYTKTVKLKATLKENKNLTLEISGSVRSYSNVNLEAPYGTDLKVEKKATLSKPVFSVEPGEIDKGTTVTITGDKDSDIIYTTDGTEPTLKNGTRVSGSDEITLIVDTTVKAVSVRNDANMSETASAEYTVRNVIPSTGGRLLGDVDNDKEIKIIDATIIQMHLAKIEITDQYNDTVADTDEDGKVSVIDATCIQKYLASLPTNEHIGQPI